jgi:hypothetical protein
MNLGGDLHPRGQSEARALRLEHRRIQHTYGVSSARANILPQTPWLAPLSYLVT